MSLITCKECGKEFSDQAAACPNCGCPNPEQNVSKSNALQDPASRYRNTNSNTEIRKKESGLGLAALICSILGCTLFIGIILAIVDLLKKDRTKKHTYSKAALVIAIIWIILSLIYGITSGNTSTTVNTESASIETELSKSPEQDSSENSETVESGNEVSEEKKQTALDADKELTDLIIGAESDYNTFIDIMNSDNATDLDIYDAAKIVDSNLGKYSVNAYNVNCDGIDEYKAQVSYYIINMQSVASDIKKYMDKENIKYLSSAKEYIEKVQSYAMVVLSERMKFLTNAGFTEAEVLEILGDNKETTQE